MEHITHATRIVSIWPADPILPLWAPMALVAIGALLALWFTIRLTRT